MKVRGAKLNIYVYKYLQTYVNNLLEPTKITF